MYWYILGCCCDAGSSSALALISFTEIHIFLKHRRYMEAFMVDYVMIKLPAAKYPQTLHAPSFSINTRLFS